MTEGTDPGDGASVSEGPPADSAAAAARRRRLAKALEGALPDGTKDETALGWSEGTDPGTIDDDWLRGEVPPHHG